MRDKKNSKDDDYELEKKYDETSYEEEDVYEEEANDVYEEEADDPRRYEEVIDHTVDDEAARKAANRQKSMVYNNNRQRKLIGFLVGFFGLSSANSALLGILGNLPGFFNTPLVAILPLINIVAIVYFIRLGSKKMKEDDPDKYFFKGIRTGLIALLITMVVGPLLLFGGCFILLNSV